MRVIRGRNVNSILPVALKVIDDIGVRRESRNGPVLYGGQVSTVYEKPQEKVVFWADRDANPFFHLYESLWMLKGRNDVAPLCRYVKRSIDYSDDGQTLHGAYGHRWRRHFHRLGAYVDQLEIIASRLKRNPDDRRSILQMWDCQVDAPTTDGGKDYPCNTIASFQRDQHGLNLTVFCRSNDIIWGAYGANAVQFGMLLEYMAHWIGCPVGTYTQVSVNWHGYLDTLEKVRGLRPDRIGYVRDRYLKDEVRNIPMPEFADNVHLNAMIESLLHEADTGFQDPQAPPESSEWCHMIWHVLRAHESYRTNTGLNKYTTPLRILDNADPRADWVVAAKEWLQRRQVAFLAKDDGD